MLIYEKRTYENDKLKITLYGTLDNKKSDSDQPLVYADTSGTELSERPTLSASYVSHLAAGGYDALRLDDGQEFIVGIKTGSDIEWVIGKVQSENVEAQSDDEGISLQSEEIPEGISVGDLITMDLGDGEKQYRIMDVDTQGSYPPVVTVAGMEAIDSSAFEILSDSNIYKDSDLDDLLTKWHVTLSDEARSAIQTSYIYQYEYPFDKSVLTDNHASYADSLEGAKKSGRLARYIYALDIDDIETYFNGEFTKDDLKDLFWTSDNADADESFWLRSASADSSVSAYYVSYTGAIQAGPVGNSCAVRPAFKIDLSKISYK